VDDVVALGLGMAFLLLMAIIVRVLDNAQAARWRATAQERRRYWETQRERVGAGDGR
jgi:hypothetical protein